MIRGWTKSKGGAVYAGVSERTFRPWLRKGLRHVRLDTGTILIRYHWIDEYLASYEVQEDEVSQIVTEIEREMEI